MTNGKANVFVRHAGSTENFNEILVSRHYGEYVEEDYISNQNHLLREGMQLMDDTNQKNLVDPSFKEYFDNANIIEIESPPTSMCNLNLKLKGPYNPLELSLIGLSEATKHLSTVAIDRYSVNSVLFENDPQVRISLCSILFLLLF